MPRYILNLKKIYERRWLEFKTSAFLDKSTELSQAAIIDAHSARRVKRAVYLWVNQLSSNYFNKSAFNTSLSVQLLFLYLDATPLGFGSLEIDLSKKSRLTHKSKKIVLSPDFLTESSPIYWSNGKRIYQYIPVTVDYSPEAVKSRPDDVKSEGSRTVDGSLNKSLYWTDTK